MFTGSDRRLLQQAVRLLLLIAIELRIEMDTTAETNAAVAELRDDVANETGVVQSAVALISGLATSLAAALAAASNAGATPEQLSQLTDVHNSLIGMTSQLAQAVATNTPSDPAAGTTTQTQTDPSAGGDPSTTTTSGGDGGTATQSGGQDGGQGDAGASGSGDSVTGGQAPE